MDILEQVTQAVIAGDWQIAPELTQQALNVGHQARTILNALKQYGMFVADNGIEWAISVAPDERIPVLHEELRKVKGADFEVVVAP